jgi:hypothetical protein
MWKHLCYYAIEDGSSILAVLAMPHRGKLANRGKRCEPWQVIVAVNRTREGRG